ncbi:Uncharacterized protein GBIM_19134 [Gryllus bimaculatus]|nr:Uncharacterized protein GBIM_19134 [Gryllus bimaculatus]
MASLDSASVAATSSAIATVTTGKAAWQDQRERERHVSLTEVAVSHRLKASEAHRRWMRRNRIHDSSFGGSSSDEDTEGGLYGHQSEAANALLYVGLGTVAIGLVISFVGTGEKGFKTLELRLIGPSLIGSGLLCCLVRIFLCVCPSPCLRRRHKHRGRHKDAASGRRRAAPPRRRAHQSNHFTTHIHQPPPPPPPRQRFFGGAAARGGATAARPAAAAGATEDIALADQTSLLLKNNTKKSVSILTSPAVAPQPSGSSANASQTRDTTDHSSSPRNSVVATTTLFLQNEKERASTAYGYKVPAINIPNFIGSNSDDDERSRRRRQSQQRQQPSEGNLLDLELQQLDSASFDICSFDSSNSQEKSVILNDNDSDHSNTVSSALRRDKMTKPRAPVNARVVPVTPKPASGLVNPDPEAHRLEEDMLLAAEVEAEIATPTPSPVMKDAPVAPKNFPAPSTSQAPLSSSPQHSEKDDLLQNEIVLSPAKLQQDIKD